MEKRVVLIPMKQIYSLKLIFFIIVLFFLSLALKICNIIILIILNIEMKNYSVATVTSSEITTKTAALYLFFFDDTPIMEKFIRF